LWLVDESDSFSLSFSSCPCSSWSSADSFSAFVCVPVDCDWVVVVVLAADRVGEGAVVIWARPTPAAAANASPTIAPTMERRLNRLNRLCTIDPFGFRGFGLTPRQSPPAPETCAALLREAEAGAVRGAVSESHDEIT